MYLEGKPKSGHNTQGADTAAALSAYNARKRSVGFRAVMLLLPVAVLAAFRSPILGFDLLLGGLCGIGNMWLVMRNNERLLDGRRSRGVYGATNLARILGVGFAPVVSAMTGPWWSMGIALAGFFTPLVLYALALRREFSTG
jgi:hypothetical protein